MIIDVLNPEIIVIGGIFAKSTHLLWPTAEVVIKRESLSHSLNSCRIVPSSLGDEIEDYAALSVATEAKYDE
jgi:glucokinase